MKKLFLVDAYALIFRMYYAFLGRPMRNAQGLNTSAIFGFVKFLRDIVNKEKPHYLGVAFDPKGGNFRHEMYPEYKANRSETPEDIKASVPYIKRILEAMRIPVLEIPGFEADDVIGTLSAKAVKEDFEVYMVTPDKDFGQLIQPNVYIYKQKKNGEGVDIIGYDRICENYGIDDPRLIIDILALWGDASDNIPGVPGIGEKSAVKLVCEYGPVENILANIDKLKGKQRESIGQMRDQLLLSKQLATIDTHVPIDFVPEKLEMEGPDVDALVEVFRELGFNMFLREMERGVMIPAHLQNGSATATGAGDSASQVTASGTPTMEATPGMPAEYPVRPKTKPDPAMVGQGSLFDAMMAPATQTATDATQTAGGEVVQNQHIDMGYSTTANTEHKYVTIREPGTLERMAGYLKEKGEFCFDTETTGFDPYTSRIVGMSFSIEARNAYYIPFDMSSPDSELNAAYLKILKPLFEDRTVAKIGQNIKFDMMVLANVGIEVRGFKYDTMILHYLLDPESRHNMNYLARRYLNHECIEIESLIGKGPRQLTMDMIPVDKVCEYAAEDADITWQLKEILWPSVVGQGLEKLYMEIEEPLIDVLASIEMTGVRIDSDILHHYGKELSVKLAEIEARIREMATEPHLNVNSAQQLGVVLFDKLKIDPNPRKTKTKQYRTDEESLQLLADRHPIVNLILEYRGIKKLLSTYIDALPQLVNPKTGRLHASFNQAVTSTGRLSSTNPNLQNIPVRDEMGREIRKAFIPTDSEHLLFSADYSQVELRLMAHLSEDPALLEAFEAGEDIHSATAAKIFGVPIGEVTSDMRRKAKTANFGIIYGISAFGLSQRLNIPRTEAKEIIDGYFASYPGVKHYMDNVIEQARTDGFVSTIFGRKRFLPDIRSGNSTTRGLAERNAINAPIQGSAADIMKLAMIAAHRGFIEKKLRSRIILQVHDELIVDMYTPEQEVVKDIVVSAMEHAAQLRVTLTVDSGVGKNWVEAH